MSHEAISYSQPERPKEQRYPIAKPIYEEALHDLERYVDGPKNRIIAIKAEMKKNRTALYWQLSRTSTKIDEHFAGPNGESLNSGAFVAGIYMFRAIELNAERKGLAVPGEVTVDDIERHKIDKERYSFEERWQRLNQEEPCINEQLSRLYGFLGKPDCIESRMGAVDMYDVQRTICKRTIQCK